MKKYILLFLLLATNVFGAERTILVRDLAPYRVEGDFSLDIGGSFDGDDELYVNSDFVMAFGTQQGFRFQTAGNILQNNFQNSYGGSVMMGYGKTYCFFTGIDFANIDPEYGKSDTYWQVRPGVLYQTKNWKFSAYYALAMSDDTTLSSTISSVSYNFHDKGVYKTQVRTDIVQEATDHFGLELKGLVTDNWLLTANANVSDNMYSFHIVNEYRVGKTPWAYRVGGEIVSYDDADDYYSIFAGIAYKFGDNRLSDHILRESIIMPVDYPLISFDSKRSVSEEKAGSELGVSATADTYNGTVPTTVKFSAVGFGGKPPYSYRWVFGDGSTGNGEIVSHTYQSSGVFSAYCVISDSLGAEAISPVMTITVR